jgi:hypothetical protein
MKLHGRPTSLIAIMDESSALLTVEDDPTVYIVRREFPDDVNVTVRLERIFQASSGIRKMSFLSPALAAVLVDTNVLEIWARVADRTIHKWNRIADYAIAKDVDVTDITWANFQYFDSGACLPMRILILDSLNRVFGVPFDFKKACGTSSFQHLSTSFAEPPQRADDSRFSSTSFRDARTPHD